MSVNTDQIRSDVRTPEFKPSDITFPWAINQISPSQPSIMQHFCLMQAFYGLSWYKNTTRHKHMYLQSDVRISMSFRIITKQHWCRTKAWNLKSPKTSALFFCRLLCYFLLEMQISFEYDGAASFVCLLSDTGRNHIGESFKGVLNILSKSLVRHLLHNTYKHHIIFARIRGDLKLWAKHCRSVNI